MKSERHESVVRTCVKNGQTLDLGVKAKAKARVRVKLSEREFSGRKSEPYFLMSE